MFLFQNFKFFYLTIFILREILCLFYFYFMFILIVQFHSGISHSRQ